MTLELFAARPLVSVTGARWQTFVGAEHKKHSTFTWPAWATKTEMDGAFAGVQIDKAPHHHAVAAGPFKLL